MRAFTGRVVALALLQDSRDDGSAPVEYVLLDCDHVLPESNKSIYDKFKLDKKKRPTIFVSGKVGAPRQVPLKHLKTGGMLTRLLKQMLEPHAAKIEKTKELKEKCLNRDVCGLLLKVRTRRLDRLSLYIAVPVGTRNGPMCAHPPVARWFWDRADVRAASRSRT